MSITNPNRFKKLNEDSFRELVRRYRAGAKYRELGEDFGINPKYINRLLRNNGVERGRQMAADDRVAVVRRWQAGENLCDLAREFDVPMSNIQVLARIRGGPPPPREMRILPPERRDELVRRYAAGERDVDLAAEFGVSRSYCRTASVKDGAGARPFKRRLPLREDAFAEITPESAYWAGMLMADGCVMKKCVRLALAAEDAAHIEKFRRFLGSGHKIHIYARGPWKGYQRQNLHSLSVSCQPMVDDLAALGIVPRKSGKEFAGPAVAMNPDFWRGVIDGDGTLYLSVREGRTRPVLSLCNGGPALLEQFRTFAQTIADFTGNIQVNKDGVHTVTLTGRAAVAVTAALYEKAPVALDRKAEKAELIIMANDQ